MHEAVVMFSAYNFPAAEKGILNYDATSHRDDLKKYPNHIMPFLSDYYDDQKDVKVFAFKLTNLKPKTKYYFSMNMGNTDTREYYFETAPGPDEKYSLLFGGDSRTDREMRQEMNLLLKNLFKNDPSIVALVHGGDMITYGHDYGLWADWLEDYELINQDDGRVLPIIAARGNHELSKTLFNQVFGQSEKNIENNYYTSHFSNLSIINLNTNLSYGGNQKRWLKKELESLTSSKSINWIIPNYHKPAFPAVKTPSGALKHWVPIFEDFQVDLVFESDGHALKKTGPVYRGSLNKQKGIIYLGEGGLGVKLRTPKKADAWYFKDGYAVSKYHVFKVTPGEEKLNVKVILNDGSVFDQFDLHKKR